MIDLKSLTIEEKISLLVGRDMWSTSDLNGKIKSLRLADGPLGLIKDDDNGVRIKTTAMPSTVVTANTWNNELAYLQGEVIADECVEHNVDVLLGPGLNIKRTPLNGRNFEYFSEDPYLAGNMAKNFVIGIQSHGVCATVKHYCVNNREYDRASQSSEVDERALREIYIRPFEIALEAEPWAMMCANNPVNGVYASENEYLMKDILREELQYDGIMMSDWNAVKGGYKAVKVGMDLAMPHSKKVYNSIYEGYQKGLISEEEIDNCVERMLKLNERLTTTNKKVCFTKEQRHDFARKIAQEGIVLLKNEDNLLPLKKEKLAIVGGMANTPAVTGGGCAMVITEYQQRSLAELLMEKTGATVDYSSVIYFDPCRFTTYMKRGMEIAYHADAVIVCVGNDVHIEAENFDREKIELNQEDVNLINKMCEVNENVIVVVYAGSAVDMSAWIDKVKAVLFCGFPGEGANQALVDILTGEVCPSGKLSETFPNKLEDNPIYTDLGDGFVEWYSDGLFVGYRYFDKKNIPVLFPFGHGLSYAKFEYSNVMVEKVSETDYVVSYDITNTSNVDGKEVSQVYVKDVFSMMIRPKKELKAYSKDFIKSGETKRIRVVLNDRAFAYYNPSMKKWHVENGDYEILIGASSADLRLKTKINVQLSEETQQSNG